MKLTALCSSIISLALITAVGAKDLGVHGRTYNIVEPDALVELKQRVSIVDWSKVISKDKMKRKVMDYRPRGLKHLPTAKAPRTRLVDMTHTLPEDVTDANGVVVYPKDYSFNPLDYITMPSSLIFINADDKKQVEWYRASPHMGNPNVTLMITGGSYSETSKALSRPVYYATEEIISRFKLTSVPAVVSQKGRMMEVIEVSL
jgi:conjugal transfer pilus assembly protein TraW